MRYDERIRKSWPLSKPTGRAKNIKLVCPFCAGDDESLSLNRETGASKCHRADCDWQGQWTALQKKMNGGGGVRATKPRAPTGAFGETPPTYWVYTNAASAEIFRVDRTDTADGKKIRQAVPDPEHDGRWRGGPGVMDGVRRELYCLPDVLAAVRAGATIWICEGEKAADALRERKLVATTASGGSSTDWARYPRYAAALIGATTVVVWRDRDDPVRRYAVAKDVALVAAARVAYATTGGGRASRSPGAVPARPSDPPPPGAPLRSAPRSGDGGPRGPERGAGRPGGQPPQCPAERGTWAGIRGTSGPSPRRGEVSGLPAGVEQTSKAKGTADARGNSPERRPDSFPWRELSDTVATPEGGSSDGR
jgi:hypothetical protein